jgi:hypothetical protein
MACDPAVFRYAWHMATQTGVFNPILWADILIYPRPSEKAPPCWSDYIRRWEEHHGLPALYTDQDGQARKLDLNGGTAAAVLSRIMRWMKMDTEPPSVFEKVRKIAIESHVGERTVHRVLRWQRDSPIPLVNAHVPEEGTRDVRHACYRFELIRDPLTFAANRDAARARHVRAFDERLDETRRAQLENQGQLIQGLMTPEEFAEAETRRVEGARGRLPKRVARRHAKTRSHRRAS